MIAPRPFRSLRPALGLIALAAMLASGPTSAFADEDESGVPGEVMIKTPFKFVKFQVDERPSWENHTYIEGQKTLHIFGLSRDQPHTIVVEPRMEQGYEAVQLQVEAEKFKRQTVKRDGERIVVFQQVFNVRFKKAGGAEPAPKAGGDKPSKGKVKKPRAKSSKKK